MLVVLDIHPKANIVSIGEKSTLTTIEAKIVSGGAPKSSAEVSPLTISSAVDSPSRDSVEVRQSAKAS